MKPDSVVPQNATPGLLFIISAPSGAGKTSLVAQLLESDPNLAVSVSHTTRKRRPTETDGLNYHFVDTQTFARMTQELAFLEHAEVFGNHYGTAKDSVSAELGQGHDVILEIDWQGARLVGINYPEAVSIFILPPSRETLTLRLQDRGQDDAAVIGERTDQAQEEMAHYADYDYLVVNDCFATAVDELTCIVAATRLSTAHRQQRLQTLISELLLKD